MPARGAGYHLATLSHDGRFWDVYVEPSDQGDGAVRGRLAFSPADATEDEVPVTTAQIFVEDSVEALVERAQELTHHQLLALLRSCLP